MFSHSLTWPHCEFNCSLDPPMNELSVLSQDATPEGFIVNDEARNEMMHIARAAHLNHDFKIFQLTFFSLGKSQEDFLRPLVQSSTSFPSVNDCQKDALSSLLSLASSLSVSGSHGSSSACSSRSVDSNISQSSVPSTSGTRLMSNNFHWCWWCLVFGVDIVHDL